MADNHILPEGQTHQPAYVDATSAPDEKQTIKNAEHHGVDRVSPSATPDYSDQEKGHTHVGAAPDGQPPRRNINNFLGRSTRHFWNMFFAIFFTGWWVASLVLHSKNMNWVVPFLVWLCVMLRVFFNYVPSRYLSKILRTVWKNTALIVYNAIPAKFRTGAGAALAVAVVLIGTFVSEESADNTRANRAVSIFGIVVFLTLFWATSRNRRRVNWRTVIVGMLAQYIIGLFVLRTQVGYDIFRFVADRAGDLLSFARKGVEFLTDGPTSQKLWFFFSVVPAIVFFISVVQILFYIGFLQWFVRKLATFVFWALGASGAEAVVAAATPFIGQGESAMLVRPFVPHMTDAELHQIMTCGFATISGSVLVAYIGLGFNKEALVSSCIMSIPASIAISKLRFPETEDTLTAGKVVIPEDEENKSENVLHAFASGTWLGLKIGGTIVASLLCVIALVFLCNGLMGWWGSYLNITDPFHDPSKPEEDKLKLQLVLGYLLYPVTFLLGVPRQDIMKVARVIAEKIITVSGPGYLLRWKTNLTVTRTNSTPSWPSRLWMTSPLDRDLLVHMPFAALATSAPWVFRLVFSASLLPAVVVTLLALHHPPLFLALSLLLRRLPSLVWLLRTRPALFPLRPNVAMNLRRFILAFCTILFSRHPHCSRG